MCVWTGSHAGGEGGQTLKYVISPPQLKKKKGTKKTPQAKQSTARLSDSRLSESRTRRRNLHCLSNHMKSSAAWNSLKRLSSLQDPPANKSAKVNREKGDNVVWLGQNSRPPCLFTAFYQSVPETTGRIETRWEHHDQELETNTVCLDAHREATDRERS